MKIYLGTDHNGYHMKQTLSDQLKRAGYDVEDEGDQRLDPEDDFPVFAAKVTTKVLTSNDSEPRGILLCGSGQGMCMAANRHRGIRAALGYDLESVRSARHDDDANVLCLPAKSLRADAAFRLVETFLNTPFAAAPRFKRRISEMDDL